VVRVRDDVMVCGIISALIGEAFDVDVITELRGKKGAQRVRQFIERALESAVTPRAFDLHFVGKLQRKASIVPLFFLWFDS